MTGRTEGTGPVLSVLLEVPLPGTPTTPLPTPLPSPPFELLPKQGLRWNLRGWEFVYERGPGVIFDYARPGFAKSILLVGTVKLSLLFTTL